MVIDRPPEKSSSAVDLLLPEQTGLLQESAEPDQREHLARFVAGGTLGQTMPMARCGPRNVSSNKRTVPL